MTRNSPCTLPSGRQLDKWRKLSEDFNKARPWPHTRIEERLRMMTSKLATKNRWGDKHPSEPESVLVHHLKQWFITFTVAVLEYKHGLKRKPKVTREDIYLLAAVAAVHDVPEWTFPDLPYPMKKDKVLGPKLAKAEQRSLEEQLEFLPKEVKGVLQEMFKAVANQSKFVGRLFKASEHLCYMSFALLELERDKREFLEVMVNSIAALRQSRIIGQSVGVRIMLEPMLKHFKQIMERIEENISKEDRE